MLLPSNSPASPRALKLGPHQGWGSDQFNYKVSGELCISSFLKYSLGSHQVPGPVLGPGDLKINKIQSLSSRNSKCSRMDRYLHLFKKELLSAHQQ